MKSIYMKLLFAILFYISGINLLSWGLYIFSSGSFVISGTNTNIIMPISGPIMVIFGAINLIVAFIIAIHCFSRWHDEKEN